MIDKARRVTEKELRKLERRIAKVYKQAQADIMTEWQAYMTRCERIIADQAAIYAAALKGGSTDATAAAKASLDTAKANLTLRNAEYQKMLDDTTLRLSRSNEIALAYANNEMPNIYAVNYNAAEKAAMQMRISFTLVNENQVKRLITADRLHLPKRVLNIPKDRLWNAKKINSAVLQGIIQGDSMPKIAERVLPIVDNNKASAVRNARTMTTEAENNGRLDSYRSLQQQGAVIQKRWVAFLDDLTRASHEEMDGETVDIEEPFSNGLMYPGDPNGDPEEVWNCRCSMAEEIIGFMDDDGNIHYLEGKEQ